MSKNLSCLIAVFFLLYVGCRSQTQEHFSGRLIDLTHVFDEDAVYWPTAEGFKLDVVFRGENPQGFHYEANNFSAAEHGGTHLDAPVHFFAGRHTADQVPLDRLIGPGIVVDVTEKCANNPDYQVEVSDLTDWEKTHRKTIDGTIVLLHTGFGKYWPDRARYMGTDERGADAVPKLHFPGLHPEAAKWLVANRTIKAIGFDTPSIDTGQSTHFESHVTLYEQNIPAFENVANLHLVPAKDFQVIALPMKIKGGSGAPLRIVAVVEE